MRTFTLILLLLTITAGYAAFSNPAIEGLKLLYAYLALTTIVCGMLSLAVGRTAPRATPVRPSLPSELR